MAEVLSDLLSSKVKSNDVINWITGVSELNCTCTREDFVAHFLTWLRSHVQQPPRERAVYPAKDRGRYTPNRKRTDHRRKNHHSSRTPQTSRSSGSSKTYHTPFKDSLSSLTDYPPLSSSTPKDEPISRLLEAAPEQVLVVKRKVDFSPISNPSATPHNTPNILPSSPPTLRRVILNPASDQGQLTDWTNRIKDHSPFQSIDNPIEASTTNMPNQESSYTSFSKNSGSTPSQHSNSDYSRNITPTKTMKSKRVALRSVLNPAESQTSAENPFRPAEIQNSARNESSSIDDTNSLYSNPYSLNASKSDTPDNGDIDLSEEPKFPQTSSPTKQPPSSRKKKIKRVPLMTISNHANPGSAPKKHPDVYDVSSSENKFSSRFRDASGETGFSNSSTTQSSFGSTDEKIFISKRRSSNENSIKIIKSPTDSITSMRPSSKITPRKVTPIKITPVEASTEPADSSRSPTKRILLTPAKNKPTLDEVVSNPALDEAKTKETLDEEEVKSKAAFNEAVQRPVIVETEVNQSELRIVYSLAEIYVVLINEAYTCNLASELYLLLAMMRSGNVVPTSLISIHRRYFVSTVVTGLEIWISHLAPNLISELVKNLDISIPFPPPQPPLFTSDISIGSVPFQLDEDTRPQFPSDRVFHVFKRIRDSFHALLRDWEEGQKSHKWNTESVLGERMKSLLNQKLQLAIFTHFSKLFISLLLKRYKVDLCQHIPGVSSSSDKLKKLQSRMLETAQTEMRLCGPATFPQSQDFFKTFIVVSQNYSLNKHLTDHLIAAIIQLNTQTKSWFLGSIEMDQSDLREDFTWNLLTLQVLAKFLGLLWYMPYYTGQQIPVAVLGIIRESRTEPFPLNVECLISDSITDGTLVLTLPWVCELLSMMDTVCITLPKSKQCLTTINNIYCQLHKLPIRTSNKVLLLFKLGWLMELVIVPYGLYSVQPVELLSYEPTLDSIPMITTTLLYVCCPWLRALKHTQTTSLQPATTPTKLSNSTINTSDDKTQLQLRENFFHNQPHTVRKVCEFLADRLHNNAVVRIQHALIPLVSEQLENDIKSWIDGHENKGLLENSFNSHLHFYLSSVVFKFCEDMSVKCFKDIEEFCTKDTKQQMSQLLPPNTDTCVIVIATKLTADKARGRCMLWWNTMVVSFVEREVQNIAEDYIKHVLSEVEDMDVGRLERFLENIEDLVFVKSDAGADIDVDADADAHSDIDADIDADADVDADIDADADVDADAHSDADIDVDEDDKTPDHDDVDKNNENGDAIDKVEFNGKLLEPDSVKFIELHKLSLYENGLYGNEGGCEDNENGLDDNDDDAMPSTEDGEDGHSNFDNEPDIDHIWTELNFIKTATINKENSNLFQKIADRSVEALITFILTPEEKLKLKDSEFEHHKNLSLQPEVIFDLFLILRDKKWIELPLLKLVSGVMESVISGSISEDIKEEQNGSCVRFIDVTLKLLSIGVITPTRLEYWMIWYLESELDLQRRQNLVHLIKSLIKQCSDLRNDALEGKTKGLPGIAHFLKQYIVSDFAIIKTKLCLNI